jgi:3-oxoacyl-(acyl-carrier-protein) synthase
VPTPEDAELAVGLGPHGYVGWHLRKRLGLRPRRHCVAACASGLVALEEAVAQLRRGACERALVIGSEAALLEPFVHSYRRLGVLAPLTREGYRGRPLDRARDGFALAEQGAAVLLERGAPDAAVDGPCVRDVATRGEGADLVRPAPGMPALDAVAQRLLRGRSIGILHPHAPGTPEQDGEELSVYARHLDEPARVYANKGALGHALGASGLVSLVIACLCARTGRRPPMPWLESPVESALPLMASAEQTPRGAAQAVFAAGFGGHVGGAVIQ